MLRRSVVIRLNHKTPMGGKPSAAFSESTNACSSWVIGQLRSTANWHRVMLSDADVRPREAGGVSVQP